MLEVLVNQEEIAEAQEILERNLNKRSERTGSILVGYQGGSQRIEAHWSTDLGIWWAFNEAENRYWNAFGTADPGWNSGYSHNIACEINPPYRGINRRMAGVFARDSEGRCYLLHTGNIGGGRKNIGKKVFLDNFRGKLIWIKHGGRLSKLALIAPLKGPQLGTQIAAFVYEVKRIKALAVEGIAPSPLGNDEFREEFEGKKGYNPGESEIEVSCNHGVVVNELADIFEREGVRIGNDRYVDLYTIDEKGNIGTLFEVKTTSIASSYYGAIGQLFFHSTRLKQTPRLVAVFPDDIERKTRRILDKLVIECLTYAWNEDTPVFGASLKRLLSDT